MVKPRKDRRLRHRVYRGPSGCWPEIPVGELLLEYFSDEQLMGWRALAKELQDYHYLWRDLGRGKWNCSQHFRLDADVEPARLRGGPFGIQGIQKCPIRRG